MNVTLNELTASIEVQVPHEDGKYITFGQIQIESADGDRSRDAEGEINITIKDRRLARELIKVLGSGEFHRLIFDWSEIVPGCVPGDGGIESDVVIHP